MTNKETQFKKADPRINRKGAPKLSTEAKAIQRLTREEVIRLISKYFHWESGKLKLEQKNPKIPAIDLFMIRAISTAIMKGDVYAFDKLMERAIGKVKDTDKTGEATTINIINDTSNRPKRNSNKP